MPTSIKEPMNAPQTKNNLDCDQSFAASVTRTLESSPVHEAEEATVYQAFVKRHGWLVERPFIKGLAALKSPNARILDIGTGPGRIPMALAKLRPDWKIHAIDASNDMVALAQTEAQADSNTRRIQFKHGNALDLPFSAQSFDLVISHNMLHHIPHPEQLFNEVHRVLRPDGLVRIKDLRRHSNLKNKFLIQFAKYALGSRGLLLEMYRESIGAALTLKEATEALDRSKLKMARATSYRGIDLMIVK